MFYKSLLVVLLSLSSVLGSPTKSNPFNGYIVGGQVVEIKDHPYQVSFHWFGGYFCGGLIVTNRWVLTAAHCMEYMSIEWMTIRAGSSLRDIGGVEYNVAKSILHPSYNWTTFEFDVSLVQTAKTITFTDLIKSIPIASRDYIEIPDGQLLTASGFGETKIASDNQTLLRAVEVPKINSSQCKELFSRFPYTIEDDMICAGYIEGGKDACFGDSGGALVDPNGCAVGIVSWGIGCGRPGLPGVYARISAFSEFINRILRGDDD